MSIPYDFTDRLTRDRVGVVAKRWNLDPVVVAAVVMQESGGHPDAFRPEPGWKYFWDVTRKQPFRKLLPSEIGSLRAPEDFTSLAGTHHQEWNLQRASMGLMQCMGAVARELGCRDPYLSALFTPFEALQYGCKKLAQLQSAHAAGYISAYNAGSPHPGSDYEQSVLRWIDRLRPLFV